MRESTVKYLRIRLKDLKLLHGENFDAKGNFTIFKGNFTLREFLDGFL